MEDSPGHPWQSPPVGISSSIKANLRGVLGSALASAGTTAPSVRHQDRLCIATFHRVIPEAQRRNYALPGLCVTPEELDFFLGYFAEHYTLAPLSVAHSEFHAGRRPRKPWLAVTFDDGQLDNFVYARPVLRRWGVKASFYIPTGHIEEQAPIWHDRIGFALLRALQQCPDAAGELLGGPLNSATVQDRIEALKELDPKERQRRVTALSAMVGEDIPDWAGLMSWDQIRQLHREGHEIGSHSRWHPLLPQCSDEELADELKGSREDLEAQLDAPVQSLCYPNGSCDARVENAAAAAGYCHAVTTAWGSNGAMSPAFRLKRFDINPFHSADARGEQSAATLAWRMSGLFPGLGG